MSDKWVIVVAAAVGAAPALITFLVQHYFERQRYKDEVKRGAAEQSQRVKDEDRLAQQAVRRQEIGALRQRVAAYKTMIEALATYNTNPSEQRKNREAIQSAQVDVLVYGDWSARNAVSEWEVNEQSTDSFEKDAEIRRTLIELVTSEAQKLEALEFEQVAV